MAVILCVMADYSVTYATTSVTVDDYIARFRHAERFEACCRQCPNYGRSWACPPFDFDVLQRINPYRSVTLLASRIVPSLPNLSFDDFNTLIRPERFKLESALLNLERLFNGLAALYIGSCLYCPEGCCTRPQGKPCRHPRRVRPSLEAYGFDMERTASELLGMELLWGNNGSVPHHVILICALFHNSVATEIERTMLQKV